MGRVQFDHLRKNQRGGALLECISVFAVFVGLVATVAASDVSQAFISADFTSETNKVTHSQVVSNLAVEGFPGLILHADFSIQVNPALGAEIPLLAQSLYNAGVASTNDVCMWGFEISDVAGVAPTGDVLAGHPCGPIPGACTDILTTLDIANLREFGVAVCYFNRTTQEAFAIPGYLQLGTVPGYALAATVPGGTGSLYSVN